MINIGVRCISCHQVIDHNFVIRVTIHKNLIGKILSTPRDKFYLCAMCLNAGIHLQTPKDKKSL